MSLRPPVATNAWWHENSGEKLLARRARRRAVWCVGKKGTGKPDGLLLLVQAQHGAGRCRPSEIAVAGSWEMCAAHSAASSLPLTCVPSLERGPGMAAHRSLRAAIPDVLPFRAYFSRPVARHVMMPKARCSKAR